MYMKFSVLSFEFVDDKPGMSFAQVATVHKPRRCAATAWYYESPIATIEGSKSFYHRKRCFDNQCELFKHYDVSDKRRLQSLLESLDRSKYLQKN